MRDIFALYVTGKNSPRMGIKEIARYLNAQGFSMRGSTWGIYKAHKVLSR